MPRRNSARKTSRTLAPAAAITIPSARYAHERRAVQSDNILRNATLYQAGLANSMPRVTRNYATSSTSASPRRLAIYLLARGQAVKGGIKLLYSLRDIYRAASRRAGA